MFRDVMVLECTAQVRKWLVNNSPGMQLKDKEI
jgi:hypothetical protein